MVSCTGGRSPAEKRKQAIAVANRFAGNNSVVSLHAASEGAPAAAAATASNPLVSNQTERTVYVGNVNPQITEDVLEQFFSCCGAVSRCVVCGEPSASNRFAFVEYVEVDAAKTSLGLDGTVLGDRGIKVSPAKGPILVGTPKVPPVTVTQLPSQTGQTATTTTFEGIGGIVNPSRPNLRPEVLSRTVAASNVDLALQETHVREFFQQVGVIARIKMEKEKNDGKEFWSVLVEYQTATAAAVAVASLDNQPLGDGMVSVEKAVVAIEAAPPTGGVVLSGDPAPDAVQRTVHIAGLDLSISEQDLVAFFESQCGAVLKSRKHVPALGVTTTFGFIEFVTLESAQKALSLNGSVLGTCQLRVMPAKGPIMAPSQNTTTQQLQLAAAAGALPQSLGLSSAAQNQQQQILAQIAMQRQREGQSTSDIPGLNPLALYSVRPYNPDGSDSDDSRDRRRRRSGDRRNSRHDRDRDRYSRRRSRSRSRDRSHRKRTRSRSRSRSRDRSYRRRDWRDRDRDRDRNRRHRSRSGSRDRYRSRHRRSRSRSRDRDRDSRRRRRSSSSDEPLKPEQAEQAGQTEDVAIDSLVESVVADAARQEKDSHKDDQNDMLEESEREGKEGKEEEKATGDDTAPVAEAEADGESAKSVMDVVKGSGDGGRGAADPQQNNGEEGHERANKGD